MPVLYLYCALAFFPALYLKFIFPVLLCLTMVRLCLWLTHCLVDHFILHKGSELQAIVIEFSVLPPGQQHFLGADIVFQYILFNGYASVRSRLQLKSLNI